MSDTQPTRAGWYADPEMPDTRRYWDGASWSDHVAPADPKPAGFSTWKGIRIVAIGILAAIAVVWIVVRLSQPSAYDCSLQRADVALGDRVAVDDACK